MPKNCTFTLIILTMVSSVFAMGVKAEGDEEMIVKDYLNESKADTDARMEWWRDARFGMFIHWGLYAVPAGQWKESKNHAEWILTTAHIPVSEYETFADDFNPVKFNAKQWVSMAKAAGMKYIVITSKHHDGFCLWDSEITDYDVIDRTPFKRDILKELSDECRKQGIVMCWYHSVMDWHHTDYLPRRKWEKRSAEGAEFSRYVEYMKSQLKELIQNYGEIGVLWFDGEWEGTWTAELGNDLYNYVRSLQPDIIVNNRVSKGRKGMAGTYDAAKFAGDFGTPEQEIPATGLGYDWETCMTMNRHWGYNKHDNNWKSEKDLIRKLVDIASKGGNFLLNIGPKADGTFPQESIDRLAAIGKWMDKNSESIYGTTASPFAKLPWGRCTQKPGKLYLHVFDWPADGRLVVPGLTNDVRKAFLLTDKKNKLKIKRTGNDFVVTVPENKGSIDTVVVFEIKGEPHVLPTYIGQDKDGAVTLEAEEADIKGDSLKIESRGHNKNIGYWYGQHALVEWDFKVTVPPMTGFAVVIDMACSANDAGNEFILSLGDVEITGKIDSTETWDDFKKITVGKVKIDKKGVHKLSIKAKDTKTPLMNLRSVKLVPITD